MEVTCDKCSKKFEIKMKKKSHGIDIVEHYFQCPKCKKRYTSFVTNQEIRKMQKEVRTYGKELREHAAYSSPATYREKVAEGDRKQKELQLLMNELKEKITSK